MQPWYGREMLLIDAKSIHSLSKSHRHAEAARICASSRVIKPVKDKPAVAIEEGQVYQICNFLFSVIKKRSRGFTSSRHHVW